MATIIQLRRDTAANWTANNPVLADGEPGYETDTKKEKIGDGFTAWNDLEYKTTESTPSTGTGNIERGAFNGQFDVSDGNEGYYDNYDSGSVIPSFSISGTKKFGTKNRVKIKGDLTPPIPEGWHKSGQPISNSPNRWNEITTLLDNNLEMNVVNRVFDIPDIQDPTVPQNLTASGTDDSSTTLSWDASTDNEEVLNYKIYQDGVAVKTVANLNTQITGLQQEPASYLFQVSAVDTSGNESTLSAGVIVETTAGIGAGPESLSNLHLWYDGTDSDSMTIDSGNTVTQFNDKSPTGKILALESNPGTFNTNYIDFDGSGILFNTEASNILIPSEDFHGFMIFKVPDIVSKNDMAFISSSKTANERFAISFRSGKLAVGHFNGSSFIGKGTNTFSNTEFLVMEFKNKKVDPQDAEGVITCNLNGTVLNDSAISLRTGTGEFTLNGINGQLASQPNSGIQHFKEFFVKSGEMTTAERDNMLAYISQKHGL